MKTLLPLLLLSLAWPAQAAVKVLVSTDRESAIYEPGDDVSFHISAFDGAKQLDWGTIHWSLSLDGYRELAKGNGTLEGGKGITVTGKLDGPGFLRLTATFTGPDQKKVTAYGAAGIAPEKLKPSLPVPDDFEAFWKKQKETLAEVPVTFELTPASSQIDTVEVWDAQIACEKNGKPVSGYYAKPKDAAPKSCPAVLWVHGAGVRSSSPGAAVNGARDGFLSMDINAHGIPNGKPKEFYAELSRGELKNYRTAGNTSRDTIYFRGMFVRLVRSIDFLTSRPEWDGKVMAVIGHSQGGLQAIVAGGLDERVTFIGSGVPAGCDHTGMKADRISGWPKIVPVDPKDGPLAEAVTASRYIDAVNFATRYDRQAIVSVGFIDRVCPPTSVYAAYNALRGKKEMVVRPAMGHAAPNDVKEEFRAALLKHARSRGGVVEKF